MRCAVCVTMGVHGAPCCMALGLRIISMDCRSTAGSFSTCLAQAVGVVWCGVVWCGVVWCGVVWWVVWGVSGVHDGCK